MVVPFEMSLTHRWRTLYDGDILKMKMGKMLKRVIHVLYDGLTARELLKIILCFHSFVFVSISACHCILAEKYSIFINNHFKESIVICL